MDGHCEPCVAATSSANGLAQLGFAHHRGWWTGPLLMEEREKSTRRFVCAADEASDDETETVASLPKGQGRVWVGEQERPQEASFHPHRQGRLGEEGAEPDRMERAKEQR